MKNTYEMAVNIKSKYTDKVYRITKFKEFNVELDITNEAGGTFDFIIPNVMVGIVDTFIDLMLCQYL